VRIRVDKRHRVVESVVARARSAGLDLEVLSDLSLIRFYYEVLRSGDFKAISYRKKKVMRGLGLLERRGGLGGKFVLTGKARRLLRRVEEEETSR
jgi:hypothetical protein